MNKSGQNKQFLTEKYLKIFLYLKMIDKRLKSAKFWKIDKNNKSADKQASDCKNWASFGARPADPDSAKIAEKELKNR